MGSDADVMENCLKPAKYANPCCPTHPCSTKNGPGTSITPTILHHILHALFFYRKTRMPSPLGGPGGSQGTLGPPRGPQASLNFFRQLEFLVGKPPFDAADEKGTYTKIKNFTPIFPATITVEAKDLITKMLNKKPEELGVFSCFLFSPGPMGPPILPPTVRPTTSKRKYTK